MGTAALAAVERRSQCIARCDVLTKLMAAGLDRIVVKAALEVLTQIQCPIVFASQRNVTRLRRASRALYLWCLPAGGSLSFRYPATWTVYSGLGTAWDLCCACGGCIRKGGCCHYLPGFLRTIGFDGEVVGMSMYIKATVRHTDYRGHGAAPMAIAFVRLP